MKLNTILKALPLALGLGFCATANAGVTATAYLELNNLFVEISTDGNTDNGGEVAPADLAQYIEIIAATRSSNSNADFNGSSSNDLDVDTTGVLSSDAQLVCEGPSCAGLGLINNTLSLDNGNLVQSDVSDYSVSDSGVSGNALGLGASGFTYGDVGISGGISSGSASSRIFNNLTTSITLGIFNSIDIRLTALYDLLVDAIISPDIASDNSRTATANATAGLSIRLRNLATGAAFNAGFSELDFAIDSDGLGDIFSTEINDGVFASDWVTLAGGIYQLEITQDSDVSASLIPEPGAVILFGMAILGLGLRARTKTQK